MRDFLSSIVSLFLSPFNWLLVLLLLAWLVKSRKWKKVCGIAAVIVFILFGNPALLNLYARWWQPKPVAIPEGNRYSCGIVTGGFGSPDAEGRGYFNISSDRFIQTLLLYQTGKISHILISGGNGKKDDAAFREAHWAKKQFLAAGVPDSVIYTEDRSDNTADNAANSKRLLDSLRFRPPYLLVTSAFHMPRAKLIFKKNGVAIIPYPCNYLEGRGRVTFFDFIPRFSGLLDWNRYLKESFAYLLYKIR